MTSLLKSNKAYLDLTSKWAANWLKIFVNHTAGGFFERLASDCSPIDLGYSRLLTQCRQIYVCSNAYCLTGEKKFLVAAQDGYTQINDSFRTKNGDGFHFSISSDGCIYDSTYDLYGHAFVLFSLAHYYQTSKDYTAVKLAKRTLNFINLHFKISPQNGYHEAIDSNLFPINKVRRQNPHMHLFEGCLSMYFITKDADYLDTADYVLDLLQNHFFDDVTSTLGEFFDNDLRPDVNSGHIVEPGHHFEWVWLLYKRLSIPMSPGKSEKIKSIMNKLFDWARSNGIDSDYGGVFNEIDRNGIVLSSSKRIWGLTEAIKAYSIMMLYRSNMREVLNQELSNLFDILCNNYVGEDGIWVEICNRDLSPQTDWLPGSTTYHIFSAIVETHSLLNLHTESEENIRGKYV